MIIENTTEKPVTRSVFSMYLLMIISILAMVIFTFLAIESNQKSILKERVETALEVEQERLSHLLQEYTLWDEAYEKLFLTRSIDKKWVDNNIGKYLYDKYGINISIVGIAGGDQKLSILNGEIHSIELDEVYKEYIKQYIVGEAGLSGNWYLEFDNDIYMASSMAFYSEDSEEKRTDKSYLVIARRIDEKYLSELSSSYKLPMIRVNSLSQNNSSLESDIFSPNGKKLISLTWTDEDNKINIIWLAGFVLLIAAVNYLLVRKVIIDDHNNRKIYEKKLDQYRMNLEKLVFERTKELEATKEHAIQANQLKSLFLSNMSHELRTPMHAILSFANLGLKKADDTKLKNYLENIRTSGYRLTSLLDDLLDLSKLEAGKMDFNPVNSNLTNIAKKAVSEVESILMDRHIKVAVTSEKSCFCSADAKLMTQVFINLLSNAINYSPDNTKISINLSVLKPVDPDENLHVLEIKIQDQGVGIPSEQIGGIFDKFIQSSETRNNAGGTGLGLAITKEIIKLHGGKIWAESPPSGEKHGSVFNIQIPVKASDSDN